MLTQLTKPQMLKGRMKPQMLAQLPKPHTAHIALYPFHAKFRFLTRPVTYWESHDTLVHVSHFYAFSMAL
jgi:hypothetical protein